MKIKNILAVGLLIILLSACKKNETKPSNTNYTNFKILNVKVTAMSFLDANTTNWDPFDGPDVFYNMEGAGGSVLYDGTSQRYKDIDKGDLPLTWDFLTAYQITNLGVTHYVTIYDYDTLDPNDLIGYIGFTMNEHKNGYPKMVTKTSGALTVSITGEWY